MKLYVLDDNGKVAFEFVWATGEFAPDTPIDDKVTTTRLLRAAVRFLDKHLKPSKG
jgi:hypothetical protein